MEDIKIGFKKFEIIEVIDENTYKAKCGKKTYFVRDFHMNLKEFNHFYDASKRFDNTGIKHPKIVTKDKKRGIIVLDFINGETVFDILRNEDLPEVIYHKIFFLSYMARMERKSLDFNPRLYRFDGKEIYYMGLDTFPYTDDNKFINKGIRLWFYTKEFRELLMDNGFDIDKSRVKDDYLINKEIVLMTCKYYH